jgi:Holliday junction resolvasome RuvABC endonuclease subunit
VILALDLATRTGLCAGDPTELPVLDNFTLPSTGEDVGKFLDAAERLARALIEQFAPTLIVFEAPVLASTTALATTRKLHGLAGVVEMVAFREGIECAEVQPSTVKKNLTGHGRAEKWDMVEACRRYGFDPKTYTYKGREASDEADAFGVWLTALRRRFPQHAHAWDPMAQRRTTP